MKEKAELAAKKFAHGLKRLEEGIDSAHDELGKDGVIQRFEFTFELFWKALKIYLEFKGVRAATPRDCLKEAFRLNLLPDEDTFLNMLDDRNLASHVYDKETADKIYLRIETNYLAALRSVLAKLALN